jgi:hypothetical protein
MSNYERAMKRAEFEASKPGVDPVDMGPKMKEAEPDCKTCRGMGIVDIGGFTGCILDKCPNCWKLEA